MFTKIQIIGASILTGLVALGIGYGVGHWVGDGDGYERALQAMAKAGIQASTTAGQDRERINHEEKNLDDAGIDRGLRDLGIMRRNDDR